jgi:hypothetical protein
MVMLRAYVSRLKVIVSVLWSTAALAGPYDNVGISKEDPAILQWAANVVDYRPAPGVGAMFSNPQNALHAADGSIVSLGDLTAEQINNNIPPGTISLSFATGLMDGPGWDLAAFENAGTFFTPPFVFAELGYVEVSTDGVAFARFPSVSHNVEPGQGIPGDTEIITSFGRAFAGVNATNIYNLAGIHPVNVGTAFDLEDLAADALVLSGAVNTNDIRFVRIADIPGNGAFLDSQGRGILDAWPTTGSGGVDLDAVGARYVVPEPGAAALAIVAVCVVVFIRCLANSRYRPSLTATGTSSRPCLPRRPPRAGSRS